MLPYASLQSASGHDRTLNVADTVSNIERCQATQKREQHLGVLYSGSTNNTASDQVTPHVGLTCVMFESCCLSAGLGYWEAS